MPLHIRLFNKEIHDIYLLASAQYSISVGDARKKSSTGISVPLAPVPSRVTITLDLGGVAGSTGRRRASTMGVTAREGPIDVQDTEYRLGPRVWGKWQLLEDDLKSGLSMAICGICQQAVNLSVSGRLGRARCQSYCKTLM